MSDNETVRTQFSFRTKWAKDDDGTKVAVKRETIILNLPKVDSDYIIEILATKDKQQITLLSTAIADVLYSRARVLFEGDKSLTAENFPYEKISWKAVASLPPTTRANEGISKDRWKEFVVDYSDQMQKITPIPLDKIANHGPHFLNKFMTIRLVPEMLNQFKIFLNTYITHADTAVNYADCVEVLLMKIKLYLETDKTNLLDNII